MTPPLATPLIEWGIDTTWANAHHLPPRPPIIWPYTTGTPDVRWPANSWADLHAGQVIRVDQGFHSPADPNADEFDIEAGAWTISAVTELIAHRAEHHIITRCYGGWDKYGLVSEELAAMELFRNVWWRIADWNLSESEARLALGHNVYAIQWASPTSNPNTTIPGTNTTLREAQADLSVALTAPLTWQQ